MMMVGDADAAISLHTGISLVVLPNFILCVSEFDIRFIKTLKIYVHFQ